MNVTIKFGLVTSEESWITVEFQEFSAAPVCVGTDRWGNRSVTWQSPEDPRNGIRSRLHNMVHIRVRDTYPRCSVLWKNLGLNDYGEV